MMRCCTFVALSCLAERFFAFPYSAFVIPGRVPVRGEIQELAVVQGASKLQRRGTAPIAELGFAPRSASHGTSPEHVGTFKKTWKFLDMF